MKPAPSAEWLEPDGRGGFASGTVSGIRSRRYHALLLTARRPPTDRVVLVNGLDAWVETPAGRQALSSQRYTPDVVHPDGADRSSAFDLDPWPTWTFQLEGGVRVAQEVMAPHGGGLTVVTWRRVEGLGPAVLTVRPFLSGRDYHSLHHENGAFRFDAEVDDGRVRWHPYADLTAVAAVHNGSYAHEPAWYRNFLYDEERARGLDFTEDLGSPGTFTFDLACGEAVLVLGPEPGAVLPAAGELEAWLGAQREAERARRLAFGSPLDRSADAYVVQRGQGKTLVAGYPWFTDWGRDTFISVRGLCLATGRQDVAGDILIEWSHAVSEGMLPNRFPDRGETPEFNSVDASLWYVVAVHEYLRAVRSQGGSVVACRGCGAPDGKACLEAAVLAIVDGYAAGTRHGIRMDDDGLLAAGEPGVQLTWMDVKLGDWVVTPRIGKPVEVQALWLNALRIAGERAVRWRDVFGRARRAFRDRFWDESRGFLADVVDADHHAGAVDTTLRPNQILAVGGLPVRLLEGERARQVVDVVEKHLWTPIGLRSLAPSEPGYRPRYEGGVAERDPAYHQGTVWPWLLGPFVEAWVAVRGHTAEARREARTRFLAPVLAHLEEAGLGHVSEIADADAPHTARGCPFQAWSLGELLRLDRVVLAEPTKVGRRARAGNRATAAASKPAHA